jgi:antirestriction protein ArdC
MQTARSDIRETVTRIIITMLEQATTTGASFPWCRPGVAHSRPTNVLSRQRYRGINHMALWATAHARDYRSGVWATYKQWQSIGAQVRRGETSTPIIVYKPLAIAEAATEPDTPRQDATGDDTAQRVARLIKGYHVFNADQVDGYTLPDLPTNDLTTSLDHVDRFVARLGLSIHCAGARALYRPADDSITMPDRTLFRDTETSTATEGYYAVLLHEIAHATGHDTRLARDLSGRFGTHSYALEELVAEWVSAMACAELGITAQPRVDHAHYIATWLRVLKADSGGALAAAAKASQAIDYIWALSDVALG